MAVALAPDWAQHFHDDNGGPASGWTVHTFESHTEDYRATYSDPAGTVLHSPAIVLNSRGEYPGYGLYLTIGLAYTLELRNPSNVPVKTVHGVVASSQGPQGVKGEKGETGDTGPKGDAGTNGTNGAIGPRGSQGEKGDAGETGPKGATGDKGDTGLTGAAGANGTNGTNGTNGANASLVSKSLSVSTTRVAIVATGTQDDLDHAVVTLSGGGTNRATLAFTNLGGLKLLSISVWVGSSTLTGAGAWFTVIYPEINGASELWDAVLPVFAWYNSSGVIQSTTGLELTCDNGTMHARKTALPGSTILFLALKVA